ncbi:hypothetical protein BDB01DRAFT_125249 [Pilobolus umbonatus]|nr:hypothetical protein BDB01DRAFT_125249 [Pilobolus umbonatus]
MIASINMVHDTAKPGVYLAEIPVNTKEDMEYKFVVDGEWRYAADLPHRTDRHGNINNVIYKQELPTL